MGQYHIPINLDKREYLSPHQLGDGLKLLEQGLSGPGGIPTAIHVLLAVSNGRGGGDYADSTQVVGRWGGDRIAIVGDYAEYDDLPEGMAPIAYALCRSEEDVKSEIKWLTEGDRVTPERRDLAIQLQAQLTTKGVFTDITPMVREYLVECDTYYHTFKYSDGDGWIDRELNLERREGM